MDNQIASVYSQSGGDLPYFAGKQYGSGWLQTLGRIAFPILKRLGTVAANTASDVLLHEKPVVESLMSNAVNEITAGGQQPRGRRPSSINTTKKRRRITTPFFTKRARK